MDQNSVGSESFVDVIANLVGILVVLVALVGLGVRDEHRRRSDPSILQRQIDALRARVQQEQKAVETLRHTLQQRSREAITADIQRLRQQLAQLRRAVSTGKQEVEKLRQAQRTASAEIERLNQQLQARQRADRTTPSPQPAAPQPETLTVPVSRPVPKNAEELHFELRGQRLSYIPLETLLGEARRFLLAASPPGSDQPLEHSVGPVGGYALRFRAETQGPTLQERVLTGLRAGRYRLVHWRLVPVDPSRGEPLPEALAERSKLWRVLGPRDPQRVFVTIWVYEDSFAAFRKLRRALYARGYRVAARPLFFADPIAGGLGGTPSYAQ